jgi:hypothetical protein
MPRKINEFEMINLISDFAKANHVTITSLTPGEPQVKDLYDESLVSLQATTENFKDMMLFIRKMERSELPLWVVSWSGHEQSDESMTFSMQISIVNIHT